MAVTNQLIVAIAVFLFLGVCLVVDIVLGWRRHLLSAKFHTGVTAFLLAATGVRIAQEVRWFSPVRSGDAGTVDAIYWWAFRHGTELSLAAGILWVFVLIYVPIEWYRRLRGGRDGERP
jgi:hypothetical protein